MANQSAESFLNSILPDVEPTDAPQEHRDLEASLLEDMDPKFPCLRMSLAPAEDCPAAVPPGLASQLDCEEQCPKRRLQAPPAEILELPQAKAAPALARRKAA